MAADEAGDVCGAPSQMAERRGDAAVRGRIDARGLSSWPDIGIGVSALRKLQMIAQEIEKRLDDVRVRRGAKSDRIRDAVIDGAAVVRDRRRQIEHVAGRKNRIVLRRKAPQDLELDIGPQ